MKLCKILLVLALLAWLTNAQALNWTPYASVSYVRTYDGVNYSIGLNGVNCENQKQYFYVGDRADNKAFSAIALTSLTTGKQIRISYRSDIDAVHCYVDGIWIAQ